SVKKSKRFFPRRRQLLLHTNGKNRRRQKKNLPRPRQLRRPKRNRSLHRHARLRRRSQKRNPRQRRNRAKRHRHHRRLPFRQLPKKKSVARQTRRCHRKRSVVSRIIRQKCSNFSIRHSNSRPAIWITNTAQPTQITAEWIAP